MKLREITAVLEAAAPLALQESYDNSGLLIGDEGMEIAGALLCVDVTPEVMDEAEERGCNLIVSHHPLIFSGQKRFTGASATQRLIRRAIKNDMAVYAAHTNADNVSGGVSFMLGTRLGLRNMRVLAPREKGLRKLAVYVPEAYAETVREVLFAAGAGTIGRYDQCSYNIRGEGTFRAGEGTRPFAGSRGERHTEPEIRVECLIPDYRVREAVDAVRHVHPYEEMAYDVWPVEIPDYLSGAGVVGETEPCETAVFLKRLKSVLQLPVLRHSPIVRPVVRRVALCGGSGAEFIPAALRNDADLFVSADFKYHAFFDARETLTLADVGHYESEKFVMEWFYEAITKKFPTFVVHKTSTVSNPIIFL